MADDLTKKDFHDRQRVSASEDYEVEYFARENGLTPEEVRDLIAKHGSDRADLEAAVKTLKGGRAS